MKCLSLIFSNSIHLPEKFKMSFSFMDEKFLIMYIPQFYWPFCQLKNIQVVSVFFFFYLSKVAMICALGAGVLFVQAKELYSWGNGRFIVRLLRISLSFMPLHQLWPQVSSQIYFDLQSLISRHNEHTEILLVIFPPFMCAVFRPQGPFFE